MGLKIIHVISSLKRGGRERQLATIVSKSDELSCPSKIVFFNESASDYFKEYGLTEKSIHIVSRNFISRLMALQKLFKKEKPDIVYAWGILESIFTLMLNPFHRFRFINGSVRHGIRSRQISHYLRSFVLHLSSNIIANSKAGLKANHLKHGYVLYNGIDQRFMSRLSRKEKIGRRRALLNGAENAVVLISVANLVPYKDYDTILKALWMLKKRYYDFYYLIVGEGPCRPAIEQKINDWGLIDHLHITGSIQNVQDYLQLSDIFIHSSKGEGCSNAILEAMAAGLPVIASDTGGSSEIVSRENGFLFRYQDYCELAALIGKCLDNPEMCRELGDASFEKVKNHFSTEAMINNYYEILDQILAG